MKPETQIKHLLKGIEPLAHCLSGYCPSARRIHVHRYDWDVLCENVSLATQNGFVIELEDMPDTDPVIQRVTRITYEGFELTPIETHRVKRQAI